MQNNQNTITIITQIALCLYKQADMLMQLIGRDLYFGEESKEPSITVLESSELENNIDNTGGRDMPPRYADGSIRQIRKSGLLQYRFNFEGKTKSVYGYSEKELHKKRYLKEIELITKIKNSPNTNKTITYKKWTEFWLKEKEPNCKPGYITSIKMYLKNDINPKRYCQVMFAILGFLQ